MDFVWPILVLLGELTLLAVSPMFEEGLQRMRAGFAVLRSAMVVQAVRR